MSPRRTKCRLCDQKIYKNDVRLSEHLCSNCDLAFFQIKEVLDEYLKGSPPSWIRNAMTHIGWVFESYPRTAAYLNLATEILFDFVIGAKPSLAEVDLEEFRYVRTSPKAILAVLEEAHIIRKQQDEILPGKLTQELQKLRLAEFDIRSMEFRAKIKEARGVLSVALTIGLLKMDEFRPQKPLTLFRILAQNIIASGVDVDRAIQETMSQISFDAACCAVSARQSQHLVWRMSGLDSGEPKIIAGIDEDDYLVFDPVILEYMHRMRERYRERIRERERLR